MKTKIILITGGSSGIGKALVKRLEKENSLIVCGRNLDRLLFLKEEFPTIQIIQADISNSYDLNKLATFIDQNYGRLDVLINNAGIGSFQNLHENDKELDYSTIEVNFKGTVSITRMFIPLLRKSTDTSSIIFISSILAKVPRYDMPIYSASKSALHSFCISLRNQLNDIKVVEVLPPMIDTPLAKSIESNDKMNPDKLASIIVSSFNKGKSEIYPGLARLANLISKIRFKRIAEIVNAN